MADDLRDQIADALTEWTLKQVGGHVSTLMPHDEEILRENSLARADAVLTVVQPELDRLRERAGRAEQAEATIKGLRNGGCQGGVSPCPCPLRTLDQPAKEGGCRSC